MLYGLVLTVHLLVCIVLIAVILFQAGRGGGFSDTFGGGAAQSMFGTRGATYLTRATAVCATIFMATSLSLASLSVQRGRSLMTHRPKTAAAKSVAIPAPAAPKTETPAATTPATPGEPKNDKP